MVQGEGVSWNSSMEAEVRTLYSNGIDANLGFLSREIHITMYFRIVLGFVSTFFYF